MVFDHIWLYIGMISIRCGRSGEVFLEKRCNICEKFQDEIYLEGKSLPCRDEVGYRLSSL